MLGLGKALRELTRLRFTEETVEHGVRIGSRPAVALALSESERLQRFAIEKPARSRLFAAL